MSNIKKSYSAWWALPFLFQESNGSRPIRILMLGFHKPSSKLNIPAKPDIMIVREGNETEAIPFPGSDIPKLAAGIAVCSSDAGIVKSAKILSHMISKRETVYREFNFHHMETIDAMRLAVRYGENWSVPYETNITDIRVLKGAHSYDVRKGHNTTVHTVIAIGKDIRHNIPVIIFKKSWKNFSDIMWLWDGGIRFLAGLIFLVNHPPKGDQFTLLSDYELDTGLKTWIDRLSGQDLVSINPKLSVTKILESVSV